MKRLTLLLLTLSILVIGCTKEPILTDEEVRQEEYRTAITFVTYHVHEAIHASEGWNMISMEANCIIHLKKYKNVMNDNFKEQTNMFQYSDSYGELDKFEFMLAVEMQSYF